MSKFKPGSVKKIRFNVLSTVSDWNFDICVIEVKTHPPFRNFSTSSEMSQNHN